MDRVASDEVKRAILDTSALCATPSVLPFNRRESIRARVRRGGVRALLISNPADRPSRGNYEANTHETRSYGISFVRKKLNEWERSTNVHRIKHVSIRSKYMQNYMVQARTVQAIKVSIFLTIYLRFEDMSLLICTFVHSFRTFRMKIYKIDLV